MPYSQSDLKQEIRDIVAADLAAGKTIQRGWLVHAVLNAHPLGAIRDRDFNLLCRQAAVVEAVREVLRDLKFAAEKPETVASRGQLPLPGFTHLQRGYPVADGEIKPIQVIGDDVLLARADLYDRMSDGCREHADEIRRYVAGRPLIAASAA